MAEIANVAVQLEEIVSAMKIPVLSGGSVDDYLCCVGRGLIQFVCAREDGARSGRSGRTSGRASREVYQSLTADRIMIHPGSVMFSRNREQGGDGPRYIVAGEIVRTTRMYAMSVSPLSLEILGKISPILLAEFGGKQADRSRDAEKVSGKTRRSGRDFTNAIRIGGEIFPIETIKGKKHVSLAWEKLKSVKEAPEGKSPDTERYKGMRGTIVLDGKYTLLAGEKLSLIMTLLPDLEPEGALDLDWPRKENFSSGAEVPGGETPGGEGTPAGQKAPESLCRLLDRLPLVLRPALWKRRPEKGEAGRELGFIALFTDGEGNYRFRCSRGFHTALNESLASLEALIDELGEDVDPELKHIVNQTYRRLSDYLG